MHSTESAVVAANSGQPPHSSSDDGRFSVLSWQQVQRLDQILEEAVPIHGRGNFPTLSVRPRRIVQAPDVCEKALVDGNDRNGQ
uniref:Uncharacterized protein n=1 Tax=Sphaerodactylus townsendi TaxID=933632 RepID=A0ACB8FQW5_9SAUR